MNKNLALVLDLLEIEQSHFEEVAEKIECSHEKNLVISHKYAFVLYAFQDFLNGKISQEEFIQIGDINSVTKKYQTQLSSQENIDKINYQIMEQGIVPENTIFILDLKVIDKNNISDHIYSKLKIHWSYVLFLK